jgi:DNA invertase Pin-like site-specific DNA recombinase
MDFFILCGKIIPNISSLIGKSMFCIISGVENIAEHGTIGPRKFLMLAERKKGGKKKGKRRKRKERKKRRKRKEKE